MPRNKISDNIEGRILQLLRQRYAQPQIVIILKLSRLNLLCQVSSERSGVSEIVNPKINFFQKKPWQTTSIMAKVVKTVHVADSSTRYSIDKVLKLFLTRHVARLLPKT